MSSSNDDDRWDRELRRTENAVTLALGVAAWLVDTGHLEDLNMLISSEELVTLAARRIQQITYRMFATNGASLGGRNVIEVAAGALIQIVAEHKPS